MIPALVLALLVQKSMGQPSDTVERVEAVLQTLGIEQIVVERDWYTAPGAPDDAFFPEPEQISLADFIKEQVTRVERKLTFGSVGTVGALILIWTVLTWLTTLERSLNRIFGARRSRSLGRRILLYWSVVTLCPLLLTAAIYGGQALKQGLETLPFVSQLLRFVGWLGPIVVGILLLATIYTLMPNTKVTFRGAMWGAVAAVPIWMVAKWAFALYVGRLVGRGNLYGTLGLLPLFLMWLNLSWWLFLFGAEIAHVSANLRQMQAAERAEQFVPTPSALMGAAVAVARPFAAGEGAVRTTTIAAQLRLPRESTEWLLEKLSTMRVITRIESGDSHQYILARPAEKILVTELLEIDEPDAAASDPAAYAPDIAKTVAAFKERARGCLGAMTLAELVAATPEPPETQGAES
jgi:membrane protein